MSFHIEAKLGQIAPTTLLPGDPLRAKYIAENFLENTICYNNVRGMLGFTGVFKGQKISVQGTGMGVPSISIYANELIVDYEVKNLIRIGTCCSINKNIKLGQLILAQSASTNSSMNSIYFKDGFFAPSANFELLQRTFIEANNQNIKVDVGNVLTSDIFYNLEDMEYWEKWSRFGVLALEMETSGLYTVCARHDAKALSVLTVSDSVFEKEKLSSLEKEKKLDDMIRLALRTAI